MMAALLLEIITKGQEIGAKRKKRTSSQQSKFDKTVTMSLVELYKNMGDFSSARGMYLQEATQEIFSPEGAFAMASESMQNYNHAKNLYKGLAEQENDELTDFWTECYLETLEKLCLWEDMANTVTDRLNHAGSFKQALLPKYISAGIHLQVSNSYFVKVF